MLIPSSLGLMLPSLSLFFMENILGIEKSRQKKNKKLKIFKKKKKEKSRQEISMCLLPSLSSPSTDMDETPAVATLTF